MSCQFCKSMKNAMRGLVYAFRKERNFRIEVTLACAVALSLAFFNMKAWETILIILLIGLVLSAELANTVVERFVDIMKPRIHPYARLIKDLMAAAVLVISCTALLIGILLFFPYIQQLLK